MSEHVDEERHTADEHKDVNAAILYVMERVEYIQKESSPQLKYTFAGEAGLIRALRPEMLHAGLFLHVVEAELLKRGQYTTSRGGTMQSTLVRLKGRLTHGPSGTHLDVEAIGEGADVGDKGAPKAMTGAYKYLLRETFCLETGDDPDKDASVPRADAQPQSRPQGRPAPQAQSGGQQGGQGPQGANGPAQQCPTCGRQGRTMKYWQQGSRAPDLECGNGCTEVYNDKTRPLRWWSHPRGGAAPAPNAPLTPAGRPNGDEGPPAGMFDDDEDPGF